MTGKSSWAVGAFSALFAGASYGFGGALSQVVRAQGFSVAHVTCAQYLCATLILAVVGVVRFRSSVSLRQAIHLGMIGSMSALSTLFYYCAIDLLSVGQAVALQFQYVWITVVIQAIVERRAPGKRVIISAGLIVGGTLLGSGMADELLFGEGLASFSLAGFCFAMLCALFYAGFIYLNGRVAIEHPAPTRMLFATLGGAIVISLVTPDFFTGGCDIAAIAPGGMLMGLIMSVVPCLGLSIAAKRLPGGIVAILSSSELPVAVLAGFLMFGESVTPLVVAGVVIICTSIALSQSDEISKR